MDIFEQELLAFWKKLNENQVRYIMIGGFAVNMLKRYGFEGYLSG